ncbi:MAG: hypothetical protein V1824_02710 [archaeon]
MKKVVLILIILITILIIGIGIYILYSINKSTTNPNPNEQQLDCIEFGCPSGSIYVGSLNSDKYYVCNCSYAQRILPENINCFSSDAEAVAEGYTKIDC